MRLLTLLLCVLLPLSALGQASEPAPSQATPPPLVPAPEEPDTTEGPEGELIPRSELPGTRKQSALRIPLQFLGASAAAAAALLATAGILTIDAQGCQDGVLCNPALFFGGIGLGAAALTFGPPLAIWGIGEAMDDRGRFWPTLGGGALGTLASFLSLLVLADQVPGGVLIAAIVLWPVAGSMTFYELTRRGPAPSGTVDAGVRVLPVVGRSRDGAIMAGLVGYF
jgi:hypothetical protein